MTIFNIKFNKKNLSVFLNGERLKYKDMGGSRRVYFGNKYVVKIENTNEYPYCQCKAERDIWERAGEDRKYLLPILQYGSFGKYDYIIQKRISIKFVDEPHLSEKHSNAWKEVISKLKEKYSLWDISEDLGCNWTVYRNKPLIVDYGL